MTARRLELGDRLAGYEITKWIGSGSRCARYLARAVGLGTPGGTVLIKRFEALDDDALVREYFSEAMIGTILDHPNIVRLHEVGFEDGCHFMVMEYVDGEFLYELARNLPQRRLPLSEALIIGIGIAAGLHYAHDKATVSGQPLSFLHGALSPGNVLVTAGGDAKIVFDHLRLNVHGVAAKLRYLSPEQCRGLPGDRRGDLFNLGLILYEITTGRYAFDADSELAILTAIVRQDAEPPSRRDPHYPRSLERIVMTALERDPARRQQTAGEIGEALESVAREHGAGISPRS